MLLNLHLGVPFQFRVAFDPRTYKFTFNLDGDELDPYLLPTQSIDLKEVIVDGGWQVDYVGFPLNNDPNGHAVSAGKWLTYACADGHRMERDWNAPVEIKILCMDNGNFKTPKKWEKCVKRKLHVTHLVISDI